jgi:glycosyltransferase involved in cell wall biosynthesis
MPEPRYRVLQVCSHPQQYTSFIVRQMTQHPKLDVLVAYCRGPNGKQNHNSASRPEEDWGVPLLEGYSWVEVPNKSSKPDLDGFFSLVNPGLWGLVRKRKFDVIQLLLGHACASFWIALSAARGGRIPVLLGNDTTTLVSPQHKIWEFPVKRLLLPRIFKLADVLLAPSTATAELFRDLGVPSERIALIPSIVDNERWSREAAEADRAVTRASWGLADGWPVVLFCSELQPWKRPQDLLQAFAQAKAPQSHLIFAGEGSMRLQLESEAKALGLEERVHFVGSIGQSQRPAAYKAASLLVLPSDRDHYPTAVCEAMICGCPVVISNEIRGRFDLIWQGITGFTYPAGNVRVLSQILSNVLRDPDQLKRLSAAARRRMEKWSPRENVEAQIQAIEQALRLRPRSKSGRRLRQNP